MRRIAMEKFWLQGVVRDGRVVLEQPLDLPDGTVVTVMDYDPDDDPRPVGPFWNITDHEFAELSEFFAKKNWEGWTEFEARLVSKYGPIPKH
jgi:hypothetical protein